MNRNFALAEAMDTERYACLSHREVAEALGVSYDTLNNMVMSGDGPPRLKVSPRIWGYPVRDFRLWQEKRMAEAARVTENAG